MRQTDTENRQNALIAIPQPQKKKTGRRKPSATKTAQKRFLRAYEACLGNVSIACQKSAVSRATFYRWTESDADFRGKLADLRIEDLKADFVEAKLLELVEEKNAQVVIHTAKTKLRGRGYGEPIREAEIDELDRLRRLIQNRAEIEQISFEKMLSVVNAEFSHLFKRELLDKLLRESEKNL